MTNADRVHSTPSTNTSVVQAEGGGKIMQNRSLFLGVGIGLFGALAVLTARYVAIVLAG
jgi:hypothetical protein